MKTCKSCGVTKTTAEFKTRNDRPCGVASKCKECARQIKRDWYARNKSRVAIYNATYHEEAYQREDVRWDRAERNRARLAAMSTKVPVYLDLIRNAEPGPEAVALALSIPKEVSWLSTEIDEFKSRTLEPELYK